MAFNDRFLVLTFSKLNFNYLIINQQSSQIKQTNKQDSNTITFASIKCKYAIIAIKSKNRRKPKLIR